MVRRSASHRTAQTRKTKGPPKTGHKDWLGRPISASQCKAGKCSVHPK